MTPAPAQQLSLKRPSAGLAAALVLAAVVSAPRAESPPAAPRFTEADRAYWAFQPVARPQVPEITPGAGPAHSIDAFVRARQLERKLRPAPAAEKRALVRRAAFDLLGLPPTPEQVAAFLADETPDAWKNLIDRLLASPRYGEHAARYWLDLVRYADSDGFKADKYRPEAWRYRDYVIRSFNADKPYDRFIREQLAGDECFPQDLDAILATGFLRHTPDEDNQKDVQRQWRTNLQEATEVTGEVFLGIGFRCARCHDHKFDPISRADYYRFQAFFAAMLPLNRVLDPSDPGREQEWLSASSKIMQELSEFEESHLVKGRQGEASKFPDYLKPILNKRRADLNPLEKQYACLAIPQLQGSDKKTRERMGKMAEWKTLKEALQKVDDRKPKQFNIQAMTDVGPVAPPTFIGKDGPEVQPGFLTILQPGPAPIPPEHRSDTTTGRRRALADWIASADNPLTARVMVNRIWQRHFGAGIVSTANDFGRQGTRPTHPALLDWLAARFIEDGWSLKAMHRTIMLSETYRQASGHPDLDGMARIDPQNRYLWRAPIRRLNGDQLRDAMLGVSGELSGKASGPGEDGSATCRSIFVKNIRNVPDPLLKAFDGPNLFTSCSKRYVSTTSIQSLLLLNGPWAAERARALARRLESVPDRRARIERAYAMVYARPPQPPELAAVEAFLDQQEQRESETGWADFCHVLLNSNEFAYFD